MTELTEVREALISALGGVDSIPANATLLDMIDALRQLNAFYHRGWGESHARLNQAKRTLRDNGIDTHTAELPESTPEVSPAVRWAREPDGGVYVFAPEADRWYVVYPWGNLGAATEAPAGAEVLVTLADVEHAIDLYRDSLRPEDRADGVPHAVARRHALAELSDAADPPLRAPKSGGGRESDLTMEDLRRGYDC